MNNQPNKVAKEGQLAKAEELMRLGHTQREIAQQLGVSNNTMTAWAKEIANRNRTTRKGLLTTFSKELEGFISTFREAERLLVLGETIPACAYKIGVSEKTLRRWVPHMDIKGPSGGRLSVNATEWAIERFVTFIALTDKKTGKVLAEHSKQFLNLLKSKA